jgi:hypothetical protein
MEFKVYNCTGVRSDVQIVNISRRGMNTPALSETISQGDYASFDMGPHSYNDVFSVMVKNVDNTAYELYGNFRMGSSGLGARPTLVLAVDRVGRGDVAMDFTRSGEHVKYFAKCEGRELQYDFRLSQEDWEDIVEDDPTSVFGLVCRARGLTLRNMDGTDPIRCGFPILMTVFWSVLLIILLVLLTAIVVMISVAIGRAVYRARG